MEWQNLTLSSTDNIVTQNRNTPLVTLAIPAYNVEDYIERSLESALNQNYQKIEFLIVPDKSTDNTFSKAKATLNKYKHLNINILPPHAHVLA